MASGLPASTAGVLRTVSRKYKKLHVHTAVAHGMRLEKRMPMLENINHKYYETIGVAEQYGEDCDVIGAEDVILDFLRKDARRESVLEIGIGGGRTTPHLLAMTKDYVGVDYSTRMVEICRQKFDSIFMVCDARNMSTFKEERFSTVVFWGNGIDEVNPRDRHLVLNEINRVLKKNGLFTFSSHNLDWNGIPAYMLEGFSLSRKPIRDNAMRAGLYVFGHATQIWSKIRRKGYAVIWEYEEPEKVAVPRYFIEQTNQVQQLLEAGFDEVKVLASDGLPLTDKNRGADYLIFYTARKK
jgi:ubiquinone/menaquinone biosynthesis C-methylase UbiE